MLGGMKVRSVLAVAASTLLIVGCSSSSEPEADPGPSSRDAAEIVRYSPLTGLPMENTPDHPVMVVKIENTAGGAPQTALNEADLVVEELVEGGLTRLAAMYYSNLPTRVGHVRSLRITDIGIVSAVNGVLVATGGANQAVSRVMNSGVQVFSEDGGSPGFSMDPTKFAPYNRWANLQTIAKKAEPGTPDGPFLPWAENSDASEPAPSDDPSAVATTPAAKVFSGASVRFSSSSVTQFRRKNGKWSRTNGHADKEFEADNLIVMFCRVGDAGYRDPAGNSVPSTELEGSGRAVVVNSEGESVDLTWKKASIDSPITFETADGTPYLLKPGRAYIALAPQGAGDLKLQ